MESRSAFSGRAQLRTWLTGILKHKIVDVFRRQSREAPLEDLGESDEEVSELFFDPQDRDHWRSFPENWGDPEKSLEQKRFWEVFDASPGAGFLRAFVSSWSAVKPTYLSTSRIRPARASRISG